jgi:hypothetical protein
VISSLEIVTNRQKVTDREMPFGYSISDVAAWKSHQDKPIKSGNDGTRGVKDYLKFGWISTFFSDAS